MGRGGWRWSGLWFVGGCEPLSEELVRELVRKEGQRERSSGREVPVELESR